MNFKLKYISQDYYYLARPGNTPRGRLYSKYHNTMQVEKRAGLMQPAIAQKKICINNRDAKLVQEYSDSNEHIRALKFDLLKPAEFMEHWRGCSKERINLIQSEADVASIMKQWPYYKLPIGYRLVCKAHSIMPMIIKIDECLFFNFFRFVLILEFYMKTIKKFSMIS